jgi:hypothetical protein
MATFSAYLRSRSDDELVGLLLRRPDLASPSPSTVSSLAARATSRSSLERALAGADAAVLQVVEAVVALRGADGAGPTAPDVVRAVAADGSPEDRAFALDALARAGGLFLVRPDTDEPGSPGAAPTSDARLTTPPGLAELFGPYPAGLAPAGTDAPVDGAGTAPVTVGAVEALLGDAPPGARQVLDALTWGPPVGVLPAPRTPARDAVQWLLVRGLLVPGDARHVLLPRHVALALRGGRTHRDLARPPAPTTGAADAEPAAPRRSSRPVTLPAHVVAAESGRAAEQLVRLVSGLVRAWEIEPAPVLRAGGLGVRELRRAAGLLEVDDAEAAFVVELAGAAGLVVDDEEESPSFAPTAAVDEWLAAELPARWAVLARTWLTTTRAAWLVGSRDDRGVVRAALDPELARPWAPRLRRSVLAVLLDSADGAVVEPAHVVEQLTWRTPRAVPPEHAVAATLREAAWLGVVAAGVLSPAGRVLLTSVPAEPLTPRRATTATFDTSPDPAAEALAGALGDPVDEVLLQADLTGVVPGRPSPALEALVERAARVESRGGALTVRFTPETVRAALDAGTTADELLAELAAHSRGTVPQPLEYLVRDAARRHGRLRAGTASSYVRAEDPALLAGLVEDPRLASLGLVRLAPTVLASHGSTRELVAALRERGLAPVAEGPDGQVVHAERVVRRVHTRTRRASSAQPGPDDGDPFGAARRERVAALVPDLRRAEEAQRAAREADRAAQARAAELRTAQERLARSEPVVTVPSAADETAPPATSGDGLRTGPGSAVPPGGAPDPAPEGTADPVTALGLLREAVADRTDVWLELVDQHGVPQRRLVRPLRVDAGRLRAVDTARDAELTVAVHRIVSVTRADPDPPDQHGTGTPDRGDA